MDPDTNNQPNPVGLPQQGGIPQPQMPQPQMAPPPQPGIVPAQPQIAPQMPQPSVPAPPQPQPQVFPSQVTPQPGMQPPVPQQPMPNQYINSHQVPGSNKKKLVFVLIPVVVVVIAIVALLVPGGVKQITNKVAGVELEDYSNTSFGFSVQVPKGWSPEERNEEFSKRVSWQEPVGDVKDQSEANKHYASISVNYELADKDYLEKSEQEYFDDIKKGLQRLANEKKEDKETSDYAPEVAVVEAEEMTTVNGLKAYKVKIKVTNFDGDKDSVGYEYGLFVYVDKKNQYQLSLRAHESEGVNNKADNILTSFTKK